MERRRLPAKSFILAGSVLALAALCLMPMFATAAEPKTQQGAYNQAVMHVTIAMTSTGIVSTPSALKPGNHLVSIKNSTSQPRGVEMIGVDKASSPTIRYTKILKPGKSEAFRWYFATGKTTYVRDIMSCTHDQRSCMVVAFGHMSKAIEVN